MKLPTNISMKNLVVLLAVTTVASALHVGVPTMSAPRRVARSYRAPTIRAALDADDNEASKNEDAAADDGGLMAEFNARLDQEGGATMFKIKSEAKQVGDAAKDTAQKVQWAGDVDAVGGFSALIPAAEYFEDCHGSLRSKSDWHSPCAFR